MGLLHGQCSMVPSFQDTCFTSFVPLLGPRARVFAAPFAAAQLADWVAAASVRSVEARGLRGVPAGVYAS